MLQKLLQQQDVSSVGNKIKQNECKVNSIESVRTRLLPHML